MPFIDCRTSVALSARTRERIKTRLGQAISALKKPESFALERERMRGRIEIIKNGSAAVPEGGHRK